MQPRHALQAAAKQFGFDGTDKSLEVLRNALRVYRFSEPRTAPCPYCNSPLRVSDEPYPARKLSEAELAELDEIAAEEVEAGT